MPNGHFIFCPDLCPNAQFNWAKMGRICQLKISPKCPNAQWAFQFYPLYNAQMPIVWFPPVQHRCLENEKFGPRSPPLSSKIWWNSGTEFQKSQLLELSKK